MKEIFCNLDHINSKIVFEKLEVEFLDFIKAFDNSQKDN